MIVMNCPTCDAEGRVPNDKINTTLVCKKCLKSFHLKPSGRVVAGPAPLTGTTAARPEVDVGVGDVPWTPVMRASGERASEIRRRSLVPVSSTRLRTTSIDWSSTCWRRRVSSCWV